MYSMTLSQSGIPYINLHCVSVEVYFEGLSSHNGSAAVLIGTPFLLSYAELVYKFVLSLCDKVLGVCMARFW